MEGKPGAAPHAARFPRRYRLGSNKNYRYVYRRGKSYPSKNLVLIYLRGKGLKIGFSVSGKVGNAVTRNRIRRYLREDARQLRAAMKGGRYIFVARPSARDVGHELLTREMRSVLSRAKLLNGTGESSD